MFRRSTRFSIDRDVCVSVYVGYLINGFKYFCLGFASRPVPIRSRRALSIPRIASHPRTPVIQRWGCSHVCQVYCARQEENDITRQYFEYK